MRVRWGLVAQFPAPLKDQALRAWKTTGLRAWKATGLRAWKTMGVWAEKHGA